MMKILFSSQTCSNRVICLGKQFYLFKRENRHLRGKEDLIWDEKQFQSYQHNHVITFGKKDMFVTHFAHDKHVFFPSVITWLCYFVRLKLISSLINLPFLEENSYLYIDSGQYLYKVKNQFKQ